MRCLLHGAVKNRYEICDRRWIAAAEEAQGHVQWALLLMQAAGKIIWRKLTQIDFECLITKEIDGERRDGFLFVRDAQAGGCVRGRKKMEGWGFVRKVSAGWLPINVRFGSEFEQAVEPRIMITSNINLIGFYINHLRVKNMSQIQDIHLDDSEKQQNFTF